LQEVWFRPFDILEIVLGAEAIVGFHQTSLRESVIRHLDEESSAYMLLGNNFVERMAQAEAESVESALNSDSDVALSLSPVPRPERFLVSFSCRPYVDRVGYCHNAR
jgi:hypothetical protein